MGTAAGVHSVVYRLNGSDDVAWTVPIQGLSQALARARQLRRMGYEAEVITASSLQASSDVGQDGKDG